jgi:hypothetical protein
MRDKRVAVSSVDPLSTTTSSQFREQASQAASIELIHASSAAALLRVQTIKLASMG